MPARGETRPKDSTKKRTARATCSARRSREREAKARIPFAFLFEQLQIHNSDYYSRGLNYFSRPIFFRHNFYLVTIMMFAEIA
jgi:hypothetical protein